MWRCYEDKYKELECSLQISSVSRPTQYSAAYVCALPARALETDPNTKLYLSSLWMRHRLSARSSVGTQKDDVVQRANESSSIPMTGLAALQAADVLAYF
jgi:hypothetical protein